jgi:hypothetical protein
MVLGDRVADYLLEHGWVTRDQVVEARRTQGFFGGQVASHLLKLGYVSESVLGEALTEITGVPYASWDHLRAIPPNALQAMPERLAERFRACPIRLEDGSLRVAMLNPKDAVAIREIQAATGFMVEPWIATEPRLYQALERWYRLRFEGTKGISLTGTSRPPTTARASTKSEKADEDTSALRAGNEVGLDGRPLDAEVSFDEYLHRPGELISDREPPPPPPAADSDAGRSIAWGALDEALGSARNRDDIAEALFAFCAGRANRTGLFAIGKEAIRGVAGRGRAFEAAELKNVSVPLGSGTVFDTALQSRDFYFGVVPGLPANRDLFTALGGRLPTSVMILPIVVKERTVALLYLDGDGGPLPRPDIPLMRRVAAKTSLAFELVLLRNKLRDV